jgi:hypothetical protein
MSLQQTDHEVERNFHQLHQVDQSQQVEESSVSSESTDSSNSSNSSDSCKTDSVTNTVIKNNIGKEKYYFDSLVNKSYYILI